MAENQIKKEKKWLYFAIGLIVGFLISAAAFVVFAMIQSQSKSITKTIEHIYSRENAKDTVVKYVNVVRKESEASTSVVQHQDSVNLVELPESYDEVDFSYAEENIPSDEDVVIEDKILAQKTVKVRFKNAEFKDIPATEDAVASSFEVQQWNTPIKNRTSYRFMGNMLQVKGLDVEKMEIIHYDQHYYLCYHGNYYLLENNNTFEKLGLPVVLTVQK